MLTPVPAEILTPVVYRQGGMLVKLLSVFVSGKLTQLVIFLNFTSDGNFWKDLPLPLPPTPTNFLCCIPVY